MLTLSAGAGHGRGGMGGHKGVAPAGAGRMDLGRTDPTHALLEQVPVPIAVVEGEEHRYAFVNAAYRALPTRRPAAVGLRLVDCLADPSICEERLAEVYRTGRAVSVRGVEHSLADGARRLWDADYTPVFAAGGAVTAVMITVHDVSASRFAVEAAEAALAESGDLLKELNHRTKNSLQLISSLLTLQALTCKDPELRGQIQEACGRVATVAHVHQRLHTAGGLSTLAVAPCLRDLCAELPGSVLGRPDPERVVVEVDPLDMSVDRIIPLALIVNELVGNALRHAYHDGGPGPVLVRFETQPGGGCRLTVADHGRGLAPGFDPARADTLGMRMIKAFASQLKGRLAVESNTPGTRFVLDIP